MRQHIGLIVLLELPLASGELTLACRPDSIRAFDALTLFHTRRERLEDWTATMTNPPGTPKFARVETS